MRTCFTGWRYVQSSTVELFFVWFRKGTTCGVPGAGGEGGVVRDGGRRFVPMTPGVLYAVFGPGEEWNASLRLQTCPEEEEDLNSRGMYEWKKMECARWFSVFYRPCCSRCCVFVWVGAGPGRREECTVEEQGRESGVLVSYLETALWGRNSQPPILQQRWHLEPFGRDPPFCCVSISLCFSSSAPVQDLRWPVHFPRRSLPFPFTLVFMFFILFFQFTLSDVLRFFIFPLCRVSFNECSRLVHFFTWSTSMLSRRFNFINSAGIS